MDTAVHHQCTVITRQLHLRQVPRLEALLQVFLEIVAMETLGMVYVLITMNVVRCMVCKYLCVMFTLLILFFSYYWTKLLCSCGTSEEHCSNKGMLLLSICNRNTIQYFTANHHLQMFEQ